MESKSYDAHRPRDPHPETASRGCRFPPTEAITKRQEILDHWPTLGLRPPPELPRALIAPVGLHPLDGELLHVADIGAGPADELAEAVPNLVQVEAAETGRTLRAGDRVPRQEARPNSADHAVMRRHDDALARAAWRRQQPPSRCRPCPLGSRWRRRSSARAPPG